MIETSLLAALHHRAAQDQVSQLVVGAVIHDGTKVLLLRRPADEFMPGIYELPSGKVDPGEDFPASLVREVREETGLTEPGIAGSGMLWRR